MDFQALKWSVGTRNSNRRTTGTIIWKLGNMQPGVSKTITMRVYVFNWAANQFTNWVYVDTDTTDTNPANDKDSETTTVGEPTAVTLLEFSATPVGTNQVKVTWDYADAIGIVAFKILRSPVSDINQTTLVRIEDVHSSQGGYDYLDTVETPGTWYYWLVEVYDNGLEHLPTKPVEVTVGPLRSILFLPLIGK